MKKLSVVLLTWNSEKHINACLDSLLASIAGYDYEMFVVDNGSTDASISQLESYKQDNITVIRNNTNRGVAAARNQALRLVNGLYVLILDIDTVMNKQALSEMLKCLDSDKQVGICACKLVSVSGETQLSCRRFPTLRYKIYNILENKGVRIKKNQSQFYLEQMNGQDAFEVDYLIGACQLFRKELLDTVGYLDESIFYGPEDADFCLRTKHLGWKVIYLPSVSIVHHYQQLTNKKVLSKMSLIHAKGLLYYFIKHRSF